MPVWRSLSTSPAHVAMWRRKGWESRPCLTWHVINIHVGKTGIWLFLLLISWVCGEFVVCLASSLSPSSLSPRLLLLLDLHRFDNSQTLEFSRGRARYLACSRFSASTELFLEENGHGFWIFRSEFGFWRRRRRRRRRVVERWVEW